MIDPRNYIPGCASYTKASEISSLQKYLKKGIKKRDEALELPENPEELKKDPLVPELSELPKGAVGLHDPREVKELPDRSLKIINPREETLVGHREDIKGAETPDLPETAIGLTDNREAALEDRREDINVPETTSLIDHREEISDPNEITELPGTRLDINETLTPELPQDALIAPGEIKEPESLETIKLEAPSSETSSEVTELPGSVIEGPEFRETPLETHRENIESNEDLGSLETRREGISDKRKVTLEDHRENLSDRRGVALENHRENIESNRRVVLEDHRENIEDKRNPKLETKKDILEDKRNVNLEDHKDVLEDKRDLSLETHREDFSDKRSPKLETKKDVLEDKRNVTLDDTQLKAPGKQKTPELSGTVISGPEVKEVGLEKSKISLGDKRVVTLETERESIEDKRNPKLETHREDISDKKTPELPGTIIGLTDKRSVALGDHRETIENPQNPELSETREDIKVPGTPDLPERSETLKVDTDTSLEDHQEKLTGTQDISGLPGDSKVMPGETKDITLPEGTTDIPGEIKDPELDTTKITRPGTDTEVVLPVDTDKLSGITEVEVLGTERMDITDNREVTLPEDRLNITNPQEVTLPDGSLPIEGEVPEIESLEDTKLLRPGETPDLDQIYSESTGKELYPLEGLDVTLPNTRLNITNPNEPFLEDERLPMEPGMSDPGWSGELSDTVIHDDGDQNPIGWDETLEGERLDIESPETPELVTIDDIKSEPEDNWTVEANQNPVGWDEALENERLDITDVNEILDGLESIEPYSSDTTLSQRGPSQNSGYVDIDQERRGNDAWPDGFSQDSAKAYGEKTETPEMMDPSQPNMATPNPWETGTDLNYVDTREASDLEQYGADTESPEARPDHKDPDITSDPDWKHVDTPGMTQGDFKEYTEGSSRDDLPKESNTGTYVSREDGSQLARYGAKTAVADVMAPDQVAGDLGKAFNWSSENMGRSGWHLDDLAIPAYKLGGSFTSFLNPSKYLRFAVEKTVGVIPLKGSAKQWILDEALAGLITARDLLEETLNLQPYRLPGSNEYAIQLLRQGMSGVDLGDVKNVVGNVASNLLSKEAVVIKNPINRPGKEDKTKDGREYRWEAMQTFESKDGQNAADSYVLANTGTDTGKSTAKKIAEVVTKALGSNQGLSDYVPSYFRDTGVDHVSSLSEDFGMIGTLSNLTKWETTKVESFDELKTALENSPYATTSSRIYGKTAGSIHRHDNVMTLDSNHVWEIIFEPYLGPENGNKSFLPSVQQINYENFYGFGINTNWSTWIPFTSFELNSRKMVQKNLNLYSGEISIPQNLEFTNELRLVICDDQYKSWKRYFNMVMDASTYLCEVHDKDYYKKVKLKDIAGKQDTFKAADVVDYYKGVVRPAPYKNLTFRCKILSMNPQLQTINMSDLLVVLKDFTEEWQGEIDSSPTELALMFSVVGENPAAELDLSDTAREKKKNDKLTRAVDKWLVSKFGKVIST